MLFCIINDFPAYGNLSGYSVKDQRACLICEENTSYEQLNHGLKTIYLRHHRFLNPFHKYRSPYEQSIFNGHQKHDISPIPLNGAHVYEKVKSLHVNFEKKEERKAITTNIWKKRSIFFLSSILVQVRCATLYGCHAC